MGRRSWVAALAVITACGGGERDAGLGTVSVDTLPSGVVSVQSSGPTAWADTAHGWHLIEAERIGGVETGPSESELINPTSVALDDQGRIYVADQNPALIKVFDDSGKLVRTIGKEGEGPGEFRQPILAVRGRHLLVHDPRLARTTLFDTAGTLVRSWASSCCYWATIALDTLGHAAIPTMGGNDSTLIRYARFRLDGSGIDTLTVLRRENAKQWIVKSNGGMMSMPVPFTPQTNYAFDPDGSLLLGWTGEYRIAVLHNGRDTATVFGRSWTPEPLADARADRAVQERIDRNKESWGEAALRNAFHRSDIPGTLPAFTGIDTDADGNRWVFLDNLGDSTLTRFDVFDSAGVYLGPVALRSTDHFKAWTWGRDQVVAAGESSDGLPVVVRFRISKGQ